jgi:murein DD-endopeptidase MepM/ murein hydrolase activator NlpD
VALWLVLGLIFLLPSAALAAPDAETGITHVTQPGDTLGELAEHYAVSLEAIVAANGISNPDLIQIGQHLLIPVPASISSIALPDSIAALDVSSLTPVEGQTWTVHVTTRGDVTLSGTFSGHALHWVAEERVAEATDDEQIRSYWALAGVHALAQPGPHSLVVETTDAQGRQETATVELTVLAGDFVTGRIVLSAATSELLDPPLVESEANRLAAIWTESVVEPLWDGEFARPVHPVWPISSPFGQRRAYNDGPVSSSHSGVDYGARQGALVLAPAAGRVVLADALDVRGNAVILDHGAGVHTGYWHLWKILVREGQSVTQGDVLGRVGTTGLSTGAHLHWEVRVGDVAVDPLQWTRELMPQEGLGSR